MLIRFARIDDDRLAALAPERWRRKAAQMRFERERRQELVVGGLLADMLRSELKCQTFDFSTSSDGKPCLPAFPEIHFALSHSDEVVMCVVADRPVGCDVEKIVPLDEDLKREIGSIGAWTFREAVFKCGVDGAEPRAVEAPCGYAAAVAFVNGGIMSTMKGKKLCEQQS